MQKVFICGNLFADAEVKTSNRNGNASEFIAFRVAVNERIKDADETTSYDVTMPKSGIIDYLKKGQKVAVTGDLRLTTAEKDGKVYPHLNIRNADVELCGSKKD